MFLFNAIGHAISAVFHSFEKGMADIFIAVVLFSGGIF